ncbi:complement factor B-like isoform X1 [Centruroides sculpturatus]|uniref:complement factor B-like isoform X1 n=1 Tax=Centruroides sculpturatus TaxID=218467 RepID=UPI000C6E82D7|nr:complement factor B-like isoform X1 [Centruroides sculpturatus]
MYAFLCLLMMFAANSDDANADQTEMNSLNECTDCCILPKQFKNGKIISQFPGHTLKIPSHTVINFKCRSNYKLKGKRTNKCINGKWLLKHPTCIPKSCQPPPLVEHGEPILQSNKAEFPISTRVKYRCDEGYELRGGNELICIKRGFSLEWSGERPICTDIKDCRDPGISSDGYRLGECCKKGSTVHYSCNSGFTLVGAETIVCTEKGWSNPRPLCRPEEFCPDPPVIPHGNLVGKKSGDFYQTNDEISIECEKGYSISQGSDLLFCDSGRWDDEFPQCSEIKCKLPKIPENGFIHEKNQSIFPFQFEINFGCQEGFILIGNWWSACTELGWSYPIPKCQKIRCPEPPTPEGGWKKGRSYEIGDIMEFGCFSGYQLLGSAKRQCLPNGRWSGELSRCDSKENDCPNPGIPINGIKIGRLYKFGNVVKFRCLPGKQLVGSKQRMCQNNGEWSGSEAICLDEHDFDRKESVSSRLQEIIDAEKTEQEDILEDYKESLKENSHIVSRAINLNHPDRLVFYFIFDISGSIGSEDFKKSVNFVKLLVKKIGVSVDGSRVGVMTFSNEAIIEFFPMIFTTTEDVITALDNLNFTKGGGTATRLALKELKNKMIPLTENTLGGKQKPIVFLMTDGKANMEGDPMQDADQLKEYGVEIYCIGITGDRQMKTLYDIASTRDEHVFILDSYDTVDWLIQEIINGSVDYSVNCGIQKSVLVKGEEEEEEEDNLGRVIGGKRAKRPWPWMAALYFADNADEDLAKAVHRCGGSIIDKYWILTAAHCFYQNDILIDKNHIVVYLGLLNVKNRKNLQKIRIEKYIFHPQYIKKTHHNDIALVKLGRQAEFNMFVRPICLPPTFSKLPKDSQLYREGERAVAIGWGYDKPVAEVKEYLQPISHLKRVKLPIQNDITCKNSLNGKYDFTDRMFCAGKGKGDEDTCKGDSGGPLMQRMKNDLGQKYWTQVGIISWGVGCAQKGNYGFYTHVSKLVEWIEETKKIE